jgi:hypothetical protein
MTLGITTNSVMTPSITIHNFELKSVRDNLDNDSQRNYTQHNNKKVFYVKKGATTLRITAFNIMTLRMAK